MKVIRVVTKDEKAVFDNDFSTDIKVMANSQIALHSISFEIVENVLTIDSANDTFSYNLTNSTPANSKDVVLTHKEYNNGNFGELFDDITLKMNNTLTYSGKQIGTQFQSFIGKKSKSAEIGYKFSPNNNYQFFVDNGTIKQVDSGANFIRKEAALPNTNDESSRATANAEFIKGCGAFQVRLRQLADSGSGDTVRQGLIVGLTETPPSSQTDNINFSHRIHCRNTGLNYKFKIGDAAEQDAGFSPDTVDPATLTQNDIVEIAVFEGNLQLRIYRQGQANVDILHTEVLDTTKKYYPVLAFRGAANFVSANTVRFHYDPWAYTVNNTVTLTDTVNVNTFDDDFSQFPVGARPPNVSRNSNTIFRLTLNQSLLEFLGFQNLVNLVSGVEATHIADKLFKATLLNDSFVVEMLSENLESYDATVVGNGQRRNLLAIVPKNDNSGFVEYEPNTPYFVDMSNIREKNIRNIKARILRSDLAEITISGLAIMTLLVKCPDE